MVSFYAVKSNRVENNILIVAIKREMLIFGSEVVNLKEDHWPVGFIHFLLPIGHSQVRSLVRSSEADIVDDVASRGTSTGCGLCSSNGRQPGACVVDYERL